MSDSPSSRLPPTPAQAVIKQRRWNVTLVWLVPIAAALVGLSMVVHDWMSAGPQITVSFLTAEGLEANKTQVKYKNVVIGLVKSINLSEDRGHVQATIALDASAKSFASEDTKFWVVRPRIGAGGVSGVDTLLSGAFIGADAGHSEHHQQHFIGLETPPPVTFGDQGKRFVLHTKDLGSLDVGSPVYYRRIPVGQVVSYALAKDGKGVDVEIFVRAPNDQYVSTNSRFWNASGIDVSLGAEGLKVDTQSLTSIVSGGIAFLEPAYSRDASPAQEYADYRLFDDQATALAPPDGEGRFIRMRFQQSLRGLEPNATVEFLGVNLGKVVAVNLDFDEKKKTFSTVVSAIIYPQRLGEAHKKLLKLSGNESDEQVAGLFKQFIAQGLRAQPRTANLLTGQLYIALDFIPNVGTANFDSATRPIEIPTAAGSFDKLQEQFQRMVDKISKLPIEDIAQNLNGSLSELQQTMKQVNTKVLPQIQDTLKQTQKTISSANDSLSEDSPERQKLGQAMDEVQRTARSVRALTDFLGRHPEALIRGRTAQSQSKAYDSAPASLDKASEQQP